MSVETIARKSVIPTERDAGPTIVHGFQKGKLYGDMKVKSCFILYPCGQNITNHPNEKPYPVMTKLVQSVSDETQVVLDPFMGSGTTGIACIRTGRRFIGIEISPEYFEIAKKRIQLELQQQLLPL